MIRSTDVFVIGGGPAGLAAAIAARRKGFEVVVADGAQPPIDKACGEGLLPDAVEILQRLGVELDGEDGLAFRGIRFVDGDQSVKADFSGRAGRGIRRVVLHQAMIRRAEKAGVTLLWKSPVRGISHLGVTLTGNTVAARWVVGADGIRSQVARWMRLGRPDPRGQRYAFRRHYRMEPWSEYAEIHWGREAQAYVTPVGSEDVCVVLISRDPSLRFNSLEDQFPQLAERLSSASASDVERGAVTLMHLAKRVWGDGVALVGDASGSVDAITGEGLSLGFHQALALADALEVGDLRRYQAAHWRLARRARRMESLLLLLDGHATFRHKVMRTLMAHPDLFSRLLAIHIGATSVGDIAATGALFGWRFVTA